MKCYKTKEYKMISNICIGDIFIYHILSISEFFFIQYKHNTTNNFQGRMREICETKKKLTISFSLFELFSYITFCAQTLFIQIQYICFCVLDFLQDTLGIFFEATEIEPFCIVGIDIEYFGCFMYTKLHFSFIRGISADLKSQSTPIFFLHSLVETTQPKKQNNQRLP